MFNYQVVVAIAIATMGLGKLVRPVFFYVPDPTVLIVKSIC